MNYENIPYRLASVILLLLLVGCNSLADPKEKVEPTMIDSSLTESNQAVYLSKFEISNNQYSKACIDSDNLYIPVNENSEFINVIMEVNINTKSKKKIFTADIKDSAINNLMCNDKWMIWEVSKADGGESRIIAQNRNSLERFEISKSEANQNIIHAPYLLDDQITWVDLNKDNEVELKTLKLSKTNERTSIDRFNLFSFFNNFTSITKENRVVWSDIKKSGRGEINIYDLDTKNKLQIPTNVDFPYAGYTKLIGNKVFSLNFKDYQKWDTQSFGYYDINTMEYVPINTGYISRFEIMGETLALINEKQELGLYRLENAALKKINIPQTHADTIDFASNGTLIIGRIDIVKGSTEITLINVK